MIEMLVTVCKKKESLKHVAIVVTGLVLLHTWQAGVLNPRQNSPDIKINMSALQNGVRCTKFRRAPD